MDPKTRNIIGWVLTALISLMFVSSAIQKLMGPQPEMVAAVGGQANMMTIAIIELAMVVFFFIPRTALLGFLFMVAYMGGAICFHLVRNEDLTTQLIITTIIWITGAIRFPELTLRLRGGKM